MNGQNLASEYVNDAEGSKVTTSNDFIRFEIHSLLLILCCRIFRFLSCFAAHFRVSFEEREFFLSGRFSLSFVVRRFIDTVLAIRYPEP